MTTRRQSCSSFYFLLSAVCVLLNLSAMRAFRLQSLNRVRATTTWLMQSSREAAGATKGKGKPLIENKYAATVFLPQTSFEQRANSAQKEPVTQKWWAENRIYEKLAVNNPGEKFTLHDGPPYANGDLHMGHALNKILKDFINRYQIMRGRKVRYVPGWDCHGLPIELKVLQGMKSSEREKLTPVTLRQKASEFAKATVEKQSKAFQRFGVWGDWDRPYLTLDPEYEAEQIHVFGQMVAKGHIYRGKKPVHWSPSSRTALAEAELEYPDNHISRSIYVGFKTTELSPKLKELAGNAQDVRVAIWTTTPWTIPANLGVAVNGELEYCLLSVPEIHGQTRFLVAKDLAAQVAVKIGYLAETMGPLHVSESIKGHDLVGTRYSHPLYERVSDVLIGGDYITTESGTGLVHTAPGHGQEDYQTGLKYGLPLLSPVDDAGCFTAEAGERFAGLSVLGDGNAAIVTALQETGTLLKEEPYNHKYPYDWRSKKPTIFRATEQWFASLSGFRDLALNAIDDTTWVPIVGRNRIASMVESRGDWCISRQRSWGVPIPVFYRKSDREPLMTTESVAHIEQIFREHGTSWAGVMKARGDRLSFPADVYLEGSDQSRGWFQSSLLTAVATEGVAPYKTVLTHGFLLDEKGYKMSKSLGNTMDPLIVIEGGPNQKEQPSYGADTLRMWAAGVDYSGDVSVGSTILKHVSENYRKVRNTMRYLLGSLGDFNPQVDRVAYEDLPSVDKYMLGVLSSLVEEVETAFETYQFYRATQALMKFVSQDLSSFYLDTSKDRLYISQKDDLRRRACQTVLHEVVEQLSVVLAPLLPHLAEEVWQHLPYPAPTQSVFEKGWVSTSARHPAHEQEKWKTIVSLRNDVNKCIEMARRAKLIGASMECAIFLYASDENTRNLLRSMSGEKRFVAQSKETNSVDDLRFLLMTSQVTVCDSVAEVCDACPQFQVLAEGSESGVSVGVSRTKGKKCERCWYYCESVGEDAAHDDLCERCATILKTK
eukprot:scaffold1431_cov167-Ochromonas_danica.AAC.14